MTQGSYDTSADYKIYMGSIPASLDEAKIRSICEAFGMLRTFTLAKDHTNPSKHKGFAFFEYVDEKVTDKAVKALNGLEFGDKKLKVQRAAFGPKVGASKPKAAAQNAGPVGFLNNVPSEKRIPIPGFAMTPSRVVQFLNMLTPEDLIDNEEYEAIREDILNVCNTFGEVVDIKIPRPDPVTGECSAAVGKVFVKFSHVVAAKQVRYRLAGRRFNRRLVVTSFYPEEYFDKGELNLR